MVVGVVVHAAHQPLDEGGVIAGGDIADGGQRGRHVAWLAAIVRYGRSHCVAGPPSHCTTAAAKLPIWQRVLPNSACLLVTIECGTCGSPGNGRRPTRSRLPFPPTTRCWYVWTRSDLDPRVVVARTRECAQLVSADREPVEAKPSEVGRLPSQHQPTAARRRATENPAISWAPSWTKQSACCGSSGSGCAAADTR